MAKVYLLLTCLVLLSFFAAAQRRDSLVVKDSTGNITLGKKHDTADKIKVDTNALKKHSPRKATIRSAIIPGWGQAYNGKYWKIPIVYTAIGIPAGLFFNNKTWYERTRYALAVVSTPNPPGASADSMNAVHPDLKPLVEQGATGSLIRYRNEFRKNMDYSIIFFLVFWGLNIVDATVDAHLKAFNVSEDLSLKIHPTIIPGNVLGLSFTLTMGKNTPKTISSPSLF